MKKQLYILLFFGFSFFVNSQNKQQIFEKKLLEHFKNQTSDTTKTTRDSLYRSYFKVKFNVSISDNFIEFDTIHKIIKNPYFSNLFEEADDEKDYVKNFPKSYSVIYQNSLVSLFENGKFACFKLDNFERDTNLENKLNTKTFKYHWIIGNQLAGFSKNSIYLWNDNKWVKSKETFPLRNQPKLFEDKEFIIYCDCNGEFGGTIYFYEKLTKKTFFTESTCANSVIKGINGYEILEHLGHGSGFTKIKTIYDPRKLTETKDLAIKGPALRNKENSNVLEKKLDLYGIQIFSSFIWKNKELFIVHLNNFTFIAEIKNNEIEIVNPLFFSDLYTHNPITSQYGEYTLINLDHYDTGLEREISVLIIKENKITKLDWNENHSR